MYNKNPKISKHMFFPFLFMEVLLAIKNRGWYGIDQKKVVFLKLLSNTVAFSSAIFDKYGGMHK